MYHAEALSSATQVLYMEKMLLVSAVPQQFICILSV
jgi:hypothetical protein